MFFWVSPRRQIMVFRRFGTLCQFHLQMLNVEYTPYPAFEDGTDRGFRNVRKPQSDAGEIPKRTYTTFKTRRKFEIKNVLKMYFISLPLFYLGLRQPLLMREDVQNMAGTSSVHIK